MSHKNGDKPVRLSLCMVVRDCAATLEPLLKAVTPVVDETIFVLGGESRDRTARVCRRYGDAVLDGARFFPADGMYDWAGARDLALSRVTGRYWLWLDGDDEVEGAEHIARVLDVMDERGWGRCDFIYNYDFDEHGNPLMVQQRERILRTALGWHWEDRVHETAHTPAEHLIGFSDQVVVNHRRDQAAGNSSERNLPILLRMLDEDPKPRTLLMVAHAYFSLARYDEAERYYTLYLERPEDDLNQWNAAMMAARASWCRHDWLSVQSWSMAALAVTPAFKDPYIYLAQAAWHGERDADKALAWLDKVDSAHEAPLGVFRNPLDYTVRVWDTAYRCYAAKGDLRRALEACKLAYAVEPTQAWRELVRFYEEGVRCETSVIAVSQIVDHMVRRADLIRAKQFVDYLLPQTIRDDARVKAIRGRLDSFLLGVKDPEKLYDEVDNHEITGDLSVIKRTQWYVRRLKARGARTVLEVGCHNGDVSRILAREGFEVTGIDISPKVIEVARRLAHAQAGVRFEAISLEQVVGQGRKYDAVLFAEILEHLSPTHQVQMLNLADEIAPLVLGSVPAEFLPYSAGLWEDQPGIRGHVFEFDQRDLEQLILTDPARHVVNCHKVTEPLAFTDSPGFGNRLFEYDRRLPEGAGITFYLGPAWEHWTPDSIDEEGLGGSETAAARLAAELAARGHRVVVYATEDGVHDGVVYRPYEQFDPKEAREVLVVSRQPWQLAERPNARTVVLWSHDTSYGDLFTEEIAANIDRIVVMSEWQRTHWLLTYPWLDETKVEVVGNAITPYPATDRWYGCGGERCGYCEGAGTCGDGWHERTPERRQHRFIFTSSADRGLDELLGFWPEVREMWPDAELHVFYGFNYLAEAKQRRPELAHYLARVMRDARQPGVFLRGRVGQGQLAAEIARSQFWLYPSMTPGGSDWYETFCINALEAQAYGAVPLTRQVGALAERFEDESAFIEEWTTENVLARLREADESWGGADTTLDQDRRRVYAARPEHLWPAIADRWTQILAEVEMAREPTEVGDTPVEA